MFAVSRKLSKVNGVASFVSRTIGQNLRYISVGTNLTEGKPGEITWQKARPWSNDESSSNKAVDNAVTIKDIFAKKKVVVFGVPAPFTGVCTEAHYPGYRDMAKDFKSQKGVDTVICYTVADPYSQFHWAKSMKNNFDDITFLADADCSWAKEHKLDRDYSGASLGTRSARFSMIVEDGVVKNFQIVEDAKNDAKAVFENA